MTTMGTCKVEGCYSYARGDFCVIHELAKAEARVAELEAEHGEDQGVIRVWRGRTERAEARVAELEEYLRDIIVFENETSGSFDEDLAQVLALAKNAFVRATDSVGPMQNSSDQPFTAAEMANARREADQIRAELGLTDVATSDAPAVIDRATSTEAEVQASIRDAVVSGRGLTIAENGITRMQIAARRPVQDYDDPRSNEAEAAPYDGDLDDPRLPCGANTCRAPKLGEELLRLRASRLDNPNVEAIDALRRVKAWADK